jgi:hypothetical protein
MSYEAATAKAATPMLVNNRSEGNAPLTVQGLVEMLRG